MPVRRSITAELRKAQHHGATIVCAVAPNDGDEMEYQPRKKGDPRPWVLKAGFRSFRYSGGECYAVKDGERYTPQPTVRPLTETQRLVLKSLAEHHDGTWYPGCGWHWDNRSTTVKIMDALVKKGFATLTNGFREEYQVTDAGRREVTWSVSVALNKNIADFVGWMKSVEGTETDKVGDQTMWSWHDFRIILGEPAENGEVRFSVAIAGIGMPMVLEVAESRETAMQRAAQVIMVRLLKRNGMKTPVDLG